MTPAFFSFILFQMFLHSSDTLKIPGNCSGTQDTLKKVLLPSLGDEGWYQLTTVLKFWYFRIQTPHRLFLDFWSDKIFTPPFGVTWGLSRTAWVVVIKLLQTSALQPVGQTAHTLLQSSSLSPSSTPCWPSGNNSRELLQKTILQLKVLRLTFECGWALLTALLHNLGKSDRQAQTQAVSQSVAVAVVSYITLEGKVLPLLQYWLDSRVKKVLT